MADGLRLLNFAALDAAGAHANPLRRTVHERLYRLQIHIPTTLGHVVRVRNVVSKLRPFAANITYLCHLNRSKLVFRFPRQLEPLPATLIRPGFQNNTDGRWANQGTPTLQLAEFLVYLEPHPGPNLRLGVFTSRPNRPMKPARRVCLLFPFVSRSLDLSFSRKIPFRTDRKGTKECSHMRPEPWDVFWQLNAGSMPLAATGLSQMGLLARGSRVLQLQAQIIQLDRLQLVHATLVAHHVTFVAVLLRNQLGRNRDRLAARQ